MAAAEESRAPGKGARSLRTRPDRGADRGADRQADLLRLVASLPGLDRSGLLLQWRNHLGGTPPAHLPAWLLMRVLAYRLQAEVLGDLDPATLHRLERAGEEKGEGVAAPFARRRPATREGVDLRPGAMLAREWRGRLERVSVLEVGFAWNGRTYGSLSRVAKAITGASWNGHRFFGLGSGRAATATASTGRTGSTRAGGETASAEAPSIHGPLDAALGPGRQRSTSYGQAQRSGPGSRSAANHTAEATATSASPPPHGAAR